MALAEAETSGFIASFSSSSVTLTLLKTQCTIFLIKCFNFFVFEALKGVCKSLITSKNVLTIK